MILNEHPDRPNSGMKAIGYWFNDHHPNFPKPEKYVDQSWDQSERENVAKYLDSGKKFVTWRGCSTCRMCGKRNGSQCLTDNTYIWPEGFSHYIREHGVKPPDEFINHILGKNKPELEKIARKIAGSPEGKNVEELGYTADYGEDPDMSFTHTDLEEENIETTDTRHDFATQNPPAKQIYETTAGILSRILFNSENAMNEGYYEIPEFGNKKVPLRKVPLDAPIKLEPPREGSSQLVVTDEEGGWIADRFGPILGVRDSKKIKNYLKI
jgi:hypothetical protein